MTTHNPYAITKLSYVKPSREGIMQQQNHMNYLTYRPTANSQKPAERWVNHGLGDHSNAISQSLQNINHPHVHAWNLIVSPNPRTLTDLKHPVLKEKFIRYLVEHTIDAWFEAQGHSVSPRYSYVYHDKDSEMTGMQQPHAHIVLAGTLQPYNSNQPYRLQRAEITLLQQTIHNQIEHVQERFDLKLKNATREREQNHTPEIPFFTHKEKPQA